MDRTPEDSLDLFLKAQRSLRYNQLYLLSPIGDREEDYDDFVEGMKKINPVLKSFKLESISKNDDDTYKALVNVSYVSDLGTYSNESAEFIILKENQVYKVKSPKIEWQEEVKSE